MGNTFTDAVASTAGDVLTIPDSTALLSVAQGKEMLRLAELNYFNILKEGKDGVRFYKEGDVTVDRVKVVAELRQTCEFWRDYIRARDVGSTETIYDDPDL